MIRIKNYFSSFK